MELLTWKELRDRLRDDVGHEYGEQTLKFWMAEAPPIPIRKPAGSRGRPHLFDYDAVLEWLIQRAEKERKSYTPAGEVRTPRGEDPLKYWKSESARLEFLRDANKLLDAEELEREIADSFAKVRARMLSVAAAVAPQLSGKATHEIREIIAEKIREGLEELCLTLNISSPTPAQSSPAPPRADCDRRPT